MCIMSKTQVEGTSTLHDAGRVEGTSTLHDAGLKI